jgi:addiction module HigA family antidote
MDHPGKILKERFLDPIGVSAYALAKGMGVPQTRISQIIHGKRSITADTAVRLGAFFGVPARWFMEIQVRYDLERSATAAEAVRACEARIWVTPSGATHLGPVPEVRPTTLKVDPELRAQIGAQAALSPPWPEREVESIVYENGVKAVIGREKP